MVTHFVKFFYTHVMNRHDYIIEKVKSMPMSVRYGTPCCPVCSMPIYNSRICEIDIINIEIDCEIESTYYKCIQCPKIYLVPGANVDDTRLW